MKISKKILFYLLLFLLFTPLIEINFEIVKFSPLKGAYNLQQKPDSISKNWFSETYQIQYGKYFNDHLGFRNFLVRLNNQIQYNLYEKSSLKSTYFGKDDILFENGYVDEYNGVRYNGGKKTLYISKQIKKIQTFFDKKNICFIPVFNTGKVSYLSEYLYTKNINKKTNYSELTKQFKKDSIFYLDLRKVFLEIKDQQKYPLFPQNGIHWTKLGAVIATDTIIRTIERKKKINLRDFYYSELYHPDSILDGDKDIELAMNLLFPLDYYKLTYPILKYDTINKYDSLKIVIIGDSYSYTLIENKIFQNITTKTELWYYNKRIIPVRANYKKIDDLDYIDELSKFDVILLIASEVNYSDFDLGTIDIFFKTDNYKIEHQENEIKKQIEHIKNNEEWYESVKVQAKERNISIERMLRRAAIYSIKERNKTNE